MALLNWLDALFGAGIWQNAGVDVPQRSKYNIVGGATATDNPVTGAVDLTFAAADGGAALAVADLAALRAIGPASRADKQRRLVKSDAATLPAGFVFDSTFGAGSADDNVNTIKPSDLAIGSAGRWRREQQLTTTPTPNTVTGRSGTGGIAVANIDSGAAADLPMQRNGVTRLTLQALGVLLSGAMSAATGAEVAHRIAATTNKATSGDDTLLELAHTDTASPGVSRILDILSGASATTRRLSVLTDGSIEVGAAGVFSLTQAQASSGAGAAATIKGQKAQTGVGGRVTIAAGDGAVPGTDLAGGIDLDLGAANGSAATSELRLLYGGTEMCKFRKYTGGAGAVLWTTPVGVLAVQAATSLSFEALNGLAVINSTSDQYFQGAKQRFGSAAQTVGLDLVVAPAGATTWTYVAGITSILDSQTSTGTGNGASRTFRAQGSGGGNGNGGHVNLEGGARNGTGLRGGVRARLNGTTETVIEATEVAAGRRVLALLRGADITTTELPANTGDLVAFLGNCNTVPSAPPVSGATVYVDGGVPKALTPGKVWTTFAADGKSISTAAVEDRGVEQGSTTDATANVVIATSPTIPVSTSVEIDVVVLAYQTGGGAGAVGDGGKFHHVGGYYRAGSGALTNYTSGGDETVTPDRRTGLTTASIRIVANASNQFEVQATGEANKNIRWTVFWRVRHMSGA